MAVTVTDLRNIFNDADAVTNWNTGSENPTDYAEAVNSISVAYNTTAGQVYATETAINLSYTIVYVWSSNTATQLGWATGPHSLFLGDGTNQIAFHQEGNDRLVFKHFNNQVQFSCFALDGSIAKAISASDYTVIGGSLSALDLDNITEIGAHYVTQSKALAGGYNCFCDIIRYGNEGIRITGGTTSDRGTFLEVVTEDRAKTDGKAHGIIRELSSGVYGTQGSLVFGTTGVGDSWFQESGATLLYEDRDVGDDKYNLKVLGNVAGGEETHFILSGCSIKSTGPGLKADFSSTGIDELDITSCNFSTVTSGISLAAGTDAQGHVFSNNVITGCGQVEAGEVPIRNCTFSETTVVSGMGAAVVWNDDINIQNCTFRDNISGILHTTDSGTVTYTNLTFSDNVYDILFLGTGTLTIQSDGSDPGKYYAPYGGTVSIVNAVSLNLSVIDENQTTVSGAWCYVEDSSQVELMNEQSLPDGTATETYNYLGEEGCVVRVRKYGFRYHKSNQTIKDTGLSLTITLAEDPQQT